MATPVAPRPVGTSRAPVHPTISVAEADRDVDTGVVLAPFKALARPVAVRTMVGALAELAAPAKGLTRARALDNAGSPAVCAELTAASRK